MSHFLCNEDITAVPTRHGDTYVTTGQSITGEHSIAIITAGDGRTDIHMDKAQAQELVAALTELVRRLP